MRFQRVSVVWVSDCWYEEHHRSGDELEKGGEMHVVAKEEWTLKIDLGTLLLNLRSVLYPTQKIRSGTPLWNMRQGEVLRRGWRSGGRQEPIC